MRDSFHIIAKATCACNLNCEYCYDLKNRQRLGNKISNLSDIDHAAKLLSKYSKNIDWLWHGGEPTMVPYEWYCEVQEVFSKYYMTNFKQSMQSNGIKYLENSELNNSMKQLGIMSGISFDILNQEARTGIEDGDISEKFCKYLESEYLRGETSEICVLTVITNKNIDKIIDTYEFMKIRFRGFKKRLGLIYVDQSLSKPVDLEIPGKMFKTYVDAFYKHLFYDTSVDAMLDTNLIGILNSLMHYNSKGTCRHGDCRKTRIGLHPDGELLYCDAKFTRFNLGQITDYESIEEIFESTEYKRLYSEIGERYAICERCEYYEYCGTGCVNHHVTEDGYLNKMNDESCYKSKCSLELVYKYLQEIKLDTEINSELLEHLTKYESLLPREVEKFLKDEGIEVDIGVNIDTDFVTRPEFKLFRAFTSKTFTNQSGELFSKQRKDYFTHIYNANKTEIDNLIKEMQCAKSDGRCE